MNKEVLQTLITAITLLTQAVRELADLNTNKNARVDAVIIADEVHAQVQLLNEYLEEK